MKKRATIITMLLVIVTEIAAAQNIFTYTKILEPYCTDELKCTNKQLSTIKAKVDEIITAFVKDLNNGPKTREEKATVYRKIENAASNKATQIRLMRPECDHTNYCDHSNQKTFINFFIYQIVAIKFEQYANENIVFDDCKGLGTYLSNNKEWYNNLRERIGSPQNTSELKNEACLSKDQRILMFISPAYWTEQRGFRTNPDTSCQQIYRYNTKSNELVMTHDRSTEDNPSGPPTHCIESLGKRIDNYINVKGHKGEGPSTYTYEGKYYFLTNELTENR